MPFRVSLAASGATTANFDAPQQRMPASSTGHKSRGLAENADLVTVTARGNHLQFAESMLYQAWSLLEPGNSLVAMMSRDFPKGILTPTDEAIGAMADGLIRIVNEARARAVGARVVLVD